MAIVDILSRGRKGHTVKLANRHADMSLYVVLVVALRIVSACTASPRLEACALRSSMDLLNASLKHGLLFCSDYITPASHHSSKRCASISKAMDTHGNHAPGLPVIPRHAILWPLTWRRPIPAQILCLSGPSLPVCAGLEQAALHKTLLDDSPPGTGCNSQP